MRNLGPLTLLGIVCLLYPQQGQAQSAVCNGNHACVAASAVAVMRPGPSFAARLASFTDSERCREASIDVTAVSADERHIACSAATDAIRLLGSCGISLRRPLEVHIMSEVRHPFSGSILGLLDIKQDRVLVTREANVTVLVKDTPYAKLPVREFYKSLIVHEVVHGVMHQNVRRPVTTHAAHEYLAYALQIESMLPAVRNRFLEAFSPTTYAHELIFNDILLFMNPHFFAARAYKHFSATPDRCAKIQSLLEGAATFIVDLPRL